MTVSSVSNKTQYVTDGVTDTFAYDFLAPAESDLVVTIDAVVIATGFTVTGEGNPGGGTVIFDVPPAAPNPPTSEGILVIFRNVAQTQELDLQPYAAFPSESVETALDKLTLLIQDMQEQVNRGIQISIANAPGVSLEWPEYNAGYGVQWSTTENVLELTDTSLVSIVDDTTAARDAAQVAEVNSVNAAGNAQNSDASALAAKDLAEEWASNLEDVPISTSPSDFSAFHWSEKAKDVVIGPLTAADIANVPAGNITATDIQAAIAELDTAIGASGSTAVYDTVADMVADTGLNVGDIVCTAGYLAVGDDGGNAYLVVTAGTGTTDGGEFIDLATHQAQGLFPDGNVNLAQWNGSAALSVVYAYENDKSLTVKSGDTVALPCDPTGGDDIQAMAAWTRQCKVSGDGELYIDVVTGVHTVNTYIDVDGTGNEVDIRGVAPVFHQITGISYTTIDGPNSIYEADVTVSAALHAAAIVGGGIGIQNAQGTLDVACANGGQVIKTIAGDRLSFTFDFFSTVGAPSNGVLDNTLTFSMDANQAVVFPSSIVAQNTGWDGSAREGFMNALNGGKIRLAEIALVYSGAGGTEHDMLFARSAGSRIDMFDRVAVCGAGDKVLRSYGGAEIYANRSYFGGAAKAEEIFQGIAGGFNQFIRCFCGGTTVGGFTSGHASFVNFTQGVMSSCNIGFRTTAVGAAMSIYPSIAHKNVTGALASGGTIAGTSAVTFARNTLALDWGPGSMIRGDFVMDSNTSDSVADSDTWHEGGVWWKEAAPNNGFSSVEISDANPVLTLTDATLSATISGDAGGLKLDVATVNRDIIMQAGGVDKFSVDGTDGSVYAEIFRPGTSSIAVNNAKWTVITGSPEGVLSATVGSMCTRTDGGTDTTLYVKETGTGTTGWRAK